jgi:hypothetical protein
LRQAQAENIRPIDLVSMLVADELHRRQDRLLECRHKLACFRHPDRSHDNFDFDFNKKMTGRSCTRLATSRFIGRGRAVSRPPRRKQESSRPSDRARRIQQGYRVI